MLTGVGGALSAVLSGTGPVSLQLANLHGDVLATVPATATATSGQGARELRLSETTEYGQPRTRPAAGVALERYGYLGTHQRDASTPGGLTLMGARLYAPTLGRFLTVDPVEGGSSNDYDDVDADPINATDLDGLWRPKWLKKAARFAVKHRKAIAFTALSAVPVVGQAASAYRVYRGTQAALKIGASRKGFVSSPGSKAPGCMKQGVL